MFAKIKSLFKNTTLKEPEWWRQNILAPRVGSGVYVTIEGALAVSAVYACVRILSETIASLPLKIYERTDQGSHVADHPLNLLLGQVSNSENTAFELREFTLFNLCLRGNGYNHIVRRGGRVVSLDPLHAKHMVVSRDPKNKQLIFDYQEPGNARVFRQRELWRIAGIGSNGITGVSPITLGRESIGLSIATELTAAKMFSNGAQIPGVLEYPHIMKDAEQLQRLRDQFADNQSGVNNAHKPLLLESGMTYKTIGMNADDAQFLESRKFQIAEIARWFRVPLHMLNELDKATFSNIEHQSIEFVRDTIRPWLVRIEQTISRDLLTEQERQALFAQHTVEGLLRGDIKARYEAYGMSIRDGWLSRNEIRELENRNREDGLDDFLIPLNMSGAEEDKKLNNALIQSIADKEITAIKIEADKKTIAEFKHWVPGFYQRHKKQLQRLAVPENRIDNYIDMRISHLTDDPVKQIPKLIKNAVAELEAIFYE